MYKTHRTEGSVVPVAVRHVIGPGGQQAVSTDEARDAIRAAATALQLDPGQFGGSACRRGGATDLRDQHGYEAAKQLVIDRGRWCTSDIADIYARASLEEHAAASVGLALAGQGVSLEEASRYGYILQCVPLSIGQVGAGPPGRGAPPAR